MLQTSAVARGAVVTLAGQWTKSLIQLAAIGVLSRLLSPAEFGKYAMVVAIIGVASVISDFGLSLGAIREKELSIAQRNNLFWSNTAIGGIAAAAVFAFSFPISSLYSDLSLLPVVQFLSIVFLANGLSVQFRADLNRSLRFGSLAIGDVVSQLGGLGIGIWVALLGYGTWALVWQQMTAAIVFLVFAVGAARWLPGWPAKDGDIRAIGKFGLYTTLTQMVNYVSSNVDSIAIGRVWGPAILGIYARAFQLYSLPIQQLAAPITRVALPALASAELSGVFRRRLVSAQTVLCYALLNVLGVAVGASAPIVALLLGSRWSDAADYLRVLAVGGVFQVFGYVYYWAYLAKAKMRTLMLCEALGRGVMVLLILSLVSFGPIWVAFGYAIGLLIIWLVTSWRSETALGVSVAPYLIRASIRPTFVAVVASLSALGATKLCSLASISDVQSLVAAISAYALVVVAASGCTPVRRDYQRLLAMLKRPARASAATDHIRLPDRADR